MAPLLKRLLDKHTGSEPSFRPVEFWLGGAVPGLAQMLMGCLEDPLRLPFCREGIPYGWMRYRSVRAGIRRNAGAEFAAGEGDMVPAGYRDIWSGLDRDSIGSPCDSESAQCRATSSKRFLEDPR